MFSWVRKTWQSLRHRRQAVEDPNENWITTQTGLSGKGLEYLDSVFRESFKREEDSNEAVWRSLPFFAAILAIALSFLGRAAEGRPSWSEGWLAVGANILFWLSTGAFI
jgi:hypothetical protein